MPGSTDSASAELAAVDFAAFALHVLDADADEAAAHDTILREIDKASGGKAVWKPLA